LKSGKKVRGKKGAQRFCPHRDTKDPEFPAKAPVSFLNLEDSTGKETVGESSIVLKAKERLGWGSNMTNAGPL